MPKLEFEKITYELNMENSFTPTSGKNKGRTYTFISIKKEQELGNDKKKYQNITVKKEHWQEFRAWLLNELNADGQQGNLPDDIPDEETDLEPF